MKLVAATLYVLHLPFTEAFKYSAKEQTFCDSMITGVQNETGSSKSP